MLSISGPLGNSSLSRVGEVLTSDHDVGLVIPTLSWLLESAVLEEALIVDESAVSECLPR
jgi:hypothetical protein